MTVRRGAFAALVDGDDEVARALVDRVRLAAVLRLEPLDHRARVDAGLGDEQRAPRRGDFLLAGVGDGRANDLLDHAAGALLTEAEQRDRVVHVAATDQVHQQARLARADAGEAVFCLERHSYLDLHSKRRASPAANWRPLGRRAGHGRLLARVTAERAGRGEFAELVPDHVFLHEHLQELVPVVHFERVPDELGDDRARAGPGLDGLLRAILVELGNLLEEFLVNVGSFFAASAHVRFSRRRFEPACCAPPQTPQNALDVYGLRTNLVLAELAAAEDQFFAAGVGAAGNAALGRDARLADRVT